MSKMVSSMHADAVGRVHASIDAQCIAWVEVDHPGKHNAVSLAR